MTMHDNKNTIFNICKSLVIICESIISIVISIIVKRLLEILVGVKEYVKYSSLIRGVVIVVVMAFMASHVTDAYGGKNKGGYKKYHECNSPKCRRCNIVC